MDAFLDHISDVTDRCPSVLVGFGTFNECNIKAMLEETVRKRQVRACKWLT